MIPNPGEIWIHYKTRGEYKIVGLGKFQVKSPDLDMKECVMYKALFDGHHWVRPLEDFIEELDYDGAKTSRFIKKS
jgi:hypothetical protein